MKRVVWSAAVVMLVLEMTMAAESPIDKGSMIIGGNMAFQALSGEAYEDTLGNDATVFEFMPSLGYFVSPNIMVGGEANFATASQGDYRETTWLVGPTAGYFFNVGPSRTQVTGSIYPFVKGFFLYGQKKEDDGTDDITTDAFIYGGQGGIVLMLSRAVGVNASVRFRGTDLKRDGAEESESGTSIGVGAGITAFLY